jgi:hypothetical protein
MRTPEFVPEQVRELMKTSSTSRVVDVKIQKHKVFGKQGQQKCKFDVEKICENRRIQHPHKPINC